MPIEITLTPLSGEAAIPVTVGVLESLALPPELTGFDPERPLIPRDEREFWQATHLLGWKDY